MAPIWSFTERSTALAAIYVHSIFSVIAMAIVLVIYAKKIKPLCRFVRFYGHSFTWILAFATIAIHVFEVLEGILLDIKTSSLRLILHAANVTAILAVICLLLLYHFVESRCFGGCLVLIILYWSAATGISIAKLKALHYGESRFIRKSAKLFLLCLSLSLYCIQVIFSMFVLAKQGIRRKFTRASRKSRSDGEGDAEDDLLALKYIHRYACFPSKLLFHWYNEILLTGFRKCLVLTDLGKIPWKESSSVNFKILKTLFEEEKKRSFEGNNVVSLARCFWKMTKSMTILAGLFKITSDVLLYTPVICLDYIVEYLVKWEDAVASNSTKEMDRLLEFIGNNSCSVHSHVSLYEFFTNAYIVSILCFCVLLLQVTMFQHHLFLAVREGIRCQCALQAMVFDKSLRLYVSDINEGRLMNHMTVDPLHIVMIFMFIHSIWTMPVQVFMSLFMLYFQLGTSALISGLLILLMVAVQYKAGQKLGNTQKKIMEQADERLKRSNEMLQSIKLLKLYAWEKIFYKSVIETRTRELRFMLRASLLRVFAISVTDGVPLFACFMTFILYHYLETEPLHPGKVFSGLALFAIFSGQLFVITLMINVASQSKISIGRLRDFLLLPEIPSRQLPSSYHDQVSRLPSLDGSLLRDKTDNGHYGIPLQSISPSPSSVGTNDFDAILPSLSSTGLSSSDFVIEISNGNFGFSDRQLLHDINVRIPAGKLTMVIGPVGSGKSSLLYAMLGEMNKISGNVVTRGRSVAFVAQKSWILNSTVAGNIMLGLPFESAKYQTVIESSGLGPDLQTFVAGDQTEIGEKGANLSGGQRQRVSIARALYSDSDIYFMDDPLSALDAQVGSHIFEEAVMKLLIGSGKTVILVTHHVQYLPRADHLIVMQNGRVFFEGNPNVLSSRSSLLSTDQDVQKLSHSKLSLEVHDKEPAFHHRPSMATGIKAALSLTTLSLLGDEVDFEEKLEKSKSKDHPKELVPETSEVGRLIQEEEISSGSISYRYFIEYFRAATFLLTILAVSFYSIRLAVRMYSDFWLTEVIEASTLLKSAKPNITRNQSDIGSTDGYRLPKHGMEYYLGIYSGLSIIAFVFVPFGILFLELMALTASRVLHQKMLQHVVSAPLRFFDTTPIGRIINRLSSDMNVIDEKLIIIFDALVYCSLAVIGGIIINCVFVPYFILPVAPIVALFVFVQRFSIATCRELQRIDCSTKSPILAHFSQMLAGISTIRAYKCEERFQLESFEKINANNMAFLFFHTCHLWLGLRLDYLGSILVLTASLSAVTTCLYGHINASTVGLVVSYAIMICSLMNWTMRHLSEVEVYFGSVERVVQYSTIESEPYETSRGELPPKEWPSEGGITFESVYLKYSPELEPVLHDFSLHIKPGSKVGICGRTGSGKSSMTLSLFRMVYITQGRILLDGYNISDVPLELLRSKLSIIPQEPVLFSGTVRFNLDPLKTKTDEAIWKALEISQLKELVSQLPGQLDMEVTEGGDNFSIGQRQLFCLARALLRDTRLLIMDEATASIDSKTDLLIQKIVKQAFSECTVITIAHRLSTILNYDQVVVLQDGRKIEEGNPSDLMRANGVFAHMLAENKM